MVAAAASPLDFHPDDALAARIVVDLAEPGATLASVAESHKISVGVLTHWLNTPRAIALLSTIESGACRHVRMATSLNLSKAADALITVLDHYKKLSATLDPADPILIRAAFHARIAAYHLYRLSRATPLTDEQIARAQLRQQQASLRQAEAAADASTTHAAPSAPAAPTAPAGSKSSPSAPPPLAPSYSSSSSSSSSSSPPSPAPPSPSPASNSSSGSSPAPSVALRGESTPPSSPPRLSAALRVESGSSPSRRRVPRPADLVRAATAAPLGSSP